jgi:hypothetical protein
MRNKPLWVIILLMLAGLACYSDSPVWPYELTPAPPTPTALPTPLPGEAEFERGDFAWTPASVTEASFRLDLTIVPEPLAPDLSNKSPQSCSQNSLLRVLHSAIRPDETIYHLVDCSGVVGWTPESNMLGPIFIVVNDRALTIESGVDETGAYKIEVSDPPYREDDPFRQRADCRVNDTVDVIAISGFSTGELYYKIRCTNPINPVVPNIGWTLVDNLFGPVRFRNGEVGIVPQEFESVNLTSEPGGDETVAVCEQDERVLITDSPVQRIDEDLFYELECADGIGWANQNFIVGPIPLEVGTDVLVTAPGVTNSTQARAAGVAPEDVDAAEDAELIEATPETDIDEELPPEEILIPAVPLTASPQPLTLENEVGQCVDATVTTIESYAGVEDVLYAQVDCDDASGWLDSDALFGPVDYVVGNTVQLGEAAIIGFSQRGIFLSVELFDIEGPSGGSRVVAGECAIDFDTMTPIDAELTDVGYYRSSTGSIVGVFYRAVCTNRNGERVEGWINQDRIGE